MRLLTSKELEILKYCLPNSSQMWAVKIMGLILDCDFRDAEPLAKIYLKGIESNGQRENI